MLRKLLTGLVALTLVITPAAAQFSGGGNGFRVGGGGTGGSGGGGGPTQPANTSVPVISGTTTVGQTLTSSTGTWSGTTPITYTYQWQRDAANITGATASTYVLAAGDVSKTMTVVVTAQSLYGVAYATSAGVGPVVGSPTGPAALTGLIGWWDASISGSFTYNSGVDINTWADQSGLGNTMTWTGFGRPTKITTFNTSFPAVLFDTAIGSAMRAPSFPMGTGNTLTMFAVATKKGPTSNTDARLMSYLGNGVCTDWGSDTSWLFYQPASGNNIFHRNGISATSFNAVAYPALNIFIVTVDSSGVMTPYTNGIAGTPGTKSGNWNNAGTMELARSGTNECGFIAEYWSGPIAEAGVATGYTAAQGVAQLYNSLGAKWNTTSSEATAFLARTTGLDTIHTEAYKVLINGLVSDGVWAKLDALYMFATQDQTTALLNLKSATYNATKVGSPTFTADRGFTGVDSSVSTNYLNTNFNPITATTPQFTTANAHFSAWSNTAAASTSAGGVIMGSIEVGTGQNQIFPKYSDNNGYFRINGTTGAYGAAAATGVGHYIAKRSTTTLTGYKNGAVFTGPTTDTNIAPSNRSFIILATADAIGTATSGFGGQVSMASIGGVLTDPDAANLYTRVRVYLTSVGVP